MNTTFTTARQLSDRDIIIERPNNRAKQFPLADVNKEPLCGTNKVHVKTKDGRNWCYDGSGRVEVALGESK